MTRVSVQPSFILTFVGGLGVMFVALLALNALGVGIEQRFRFAIFLTPLMLLVLKKNTSPLLQWSLIGALVPVIILFVFPILEIIVGEPGVWDFQLFWTYGQASAQGLNPYDQSNLLMIAEPLNLDSGVLAELFFFYPPPALLYLAPLGWFDLGPAHIFWHLLHSLILIGCIGLLWDLFWPNTGFQGMVTIATIVLILAPTTLNYEHSQLNFQLLLFTLLYVRDHDKPRGGIWLALASFTKPFGLILLLYPIVKRRWQTIAVVIGTMAALSLITILIYGLGMFLEYFQSNPIANDMPAYLYTEPVNQSLLATILRWTGEDPALGNPMLNPIFVVVGGGLTAFTAWIIYRFDDRHADWLIAVIVALALLLFPKTLSHYSVLLLVPIGVLVKYRSEVPGGIWGSIALVTIIAFILTYPGREFFAFVAAWLMLVGISVIWHFSPETLAISEQTM